jgi:hypothetical protein
MNLIGTIVAVFERGYVMRAPAIPAAGMMPATAHQRGNAQRSSGHHRFDAGVACRGEAVAGRLDFASDLR